MRGWERLRGKWEAEEGSAGQTTQDGPPKDIAHEVVESQWFWLLMNAAYFAANGFQEEATEELSPTLQPTAPRKASLIIVSCIKLMFQHGWKEGMK